MMLADRGGAQPIHWNSQWSGGLRRRSSNSPLQEAYLRLWLLVRFRHKSAMVLPGLPRISGLGNILKNCILQWWHFSLQACEKQTGAIQVHKDARILRVIKILRIFKIVRILKAVKIVEWVILYVWLHCSWRYLPFTGLLKITPWYTLDLPYSKFADCWWLQPCACTYLHAFIFVLRSTMQIRRMTS